MATTTSFGWEIPDDSDLVKDGALAMRTLGNAIDASMTDLKGGTTGQVLSKTSNTDMDFTWVTSDDANAIQNAIVDAKGDLITATAADTPARLAVGSNGQVLTADSTTATGLKWAAAAGGGKVLQVVAAYYNTEVSNSTNVGADTGLSCSITPTSSTSKVLVLVTQSARKNSSNVENGVNLRLFRGSTGLDEWTKYAFYTNSGIFNSGTLCYNYLDSPATTSATTYKTQFRNAINAAAVQVQFDSAFSSMILLEIGA